MKLNTRKARKEYTCFATGKIISKGDTYIDVYCNTSIPGSIAHFRFIATCSEEIIQKYIKNYINDLLSFDDYNPDDLDLQYQIEAEWEN